MILLVHARAHLHCTISYRFWALVTHFTRYSCQKLQLVIEEHSEHDKVKDNTMMASQVEPEVVASASLNVYDYDTDIDHSDNSSEEVAKNESASASAAVAVKKESEYDYDTDDGDGDGGGKPAASSSTLARSVSNTETGS